MPPANDNAYGSAYAYACACSIRIPSASVNASRIHRMRIPLPPSSLPHHAYAFAFKDDGKTAIITHSRSVLPRSGRCLQTAT